MLKNKDNREIKRAKWVNPLRYWLIMALAMAGVSVLIMHFFNTPKAYALIWERGEILEHYKLLEAKIAKAEAQLAEINERDNKVYRPLFGLDSVSQIIPYKSTDKAEQVTERLAHLSTLLYNQSKSLDEVQLSANDSEKLSEAIPAIWPIDRTVLRRGIGAYGYRIHPIYRRRIMHRGIDLSCPTGSPIYATADGVVESSQKGYRRSGYGQMLLLRHNFGYKTRYAHLSERMVNVGDTVRRGDIIGLVGSTGGSTGSHLHYEVIIAGRTVDPINFFDRNMSKEEYESLMAQMQESKFDTFDEQ